MKTFKNSGFSVVEILIAIVVVGLIGFVGYIGYNRISDNNDATSVTEQSATAEDVKTDTVPAEVNDTADLDDALTALDQIDGSETTNDATLIDDHVSEF